MGRHSSQTTTYEFTAFTESDLLNAGSGNGSSLGHGDSFTMPGCASVEFSVTDNDSRLSGDSRRNENSNDSSGQQASIMQDGQEIGNGGQIYAEQYLWLCDENGNWFLMIEIEQEGSDEDFFVFHEAYGMPEAGAELSVYCGGNISCWEPRFEDLGAPEVKTVPVIDAVDDCIEVFATDGEGDIDGNILENDVADGAEIVSLTVDGVTVAVNEWVDLADGGKVRIMENGDLDFSADGDFDDLGNGAKRDVSFTYSIGTEEAGEPVETKLDFNGLARGELVADQFAADGVTISSANGDNPVMIFDTANVSGGDHDLASSSLGKVLILSEDGDSNDPDDNAGGGTFIFDFDSNAKVTGLTFLDTEKRAKITFFDDQGEVISTQSGPRTRDGKAKTKSFDVEGVARMEVQLFGSGALDNLKFELQPDPIMVIADEATVKISVTGVNTGPVAFDNAYSTGQDTPVSGNIITDAGVDGTDNDADGDDLDVTSVTVNGAALDLGVATAVTSDDGSFTGTLTVNDDGSYDFVPGADMVALGAGDSTTVSFSYVISDGSADASANVVITIDGENDGPVALDNAYSTGQDTPISGNIITDAGVDGVDSDVDGDDLDVTSVTVNNASLQLGVATAVTSDDGNFTGTLTVNDDGSYDFVPGADMVGLGSGDSTTVSFSYVISDGAASAGADVVITIDGENDGPVAFDNAYSTGQGTPISGNIISDAGVDGTDNDVDGDDLNVTSVTANSAPLVLGVATAVVSDDGNFNGLLTVNDDGSYDFAPGADMIGLGEGESTTVSFSYVISDGAASAGADVVITIDGADDAPTAFNNAYSVDEDAAAGVIGNILTDASVDGDVDSDPDLNDSISVVSVTVEGIVFGLDEDIPVTTGDGRSATISVSASGELTFSDDGNFDDLNDDETDTVAFEYTIEDEDGDASTASVTVDVNGSTDTIQYNVFFLVDVSASLDNDDEAHGLFIGQNVDLNNDGAFNTVLDAELATVQAYVDALSALDGPGTEFQIGVTTFASPLSSIFQNADPIPLTNDVDGGNVFAPGDDLSTAFEDAVSIGGTAIWNTAMRGANEFFEANARDEDVVNLVYVLSDSEGAEITSLLAPDIDRTLAEELADLTDPNGLNAVIDTIIYNDTDEENDDLLEMDNTPNSNIPGSPINLIENQADLDVLVGDPLLENLGII